MSFEKHRSSAQRKHFWTPLRLALTVLALSLVAAVGASSCNSTEEIAKTKNGAPGSLEDPSLAAPPAAVALATLPAVVRDAQLKALNGAPIKLSDYAGKVLLVNLWATWCGPCRLEIPELVKFHKAYQAKGLEVVGLSTEDPEGSASTVRNFVQYFNVSYRVGWATPEVAITLMQGRESIPQSFIISREGRVLKRFVGFNATATPAQLKQAIDEALNN